MIPLSARCLGVVAVCLALAGCMTQEKYEAVSTALEGSASLRAKAVNDCSLKSSDWTKQATETAALLLEVPASRAPRLACQRTVNAVASGKLSYHDMIKMRRGEITPKLVRILQGR
jgi:hypothetical protein